MVSGNGDDFGWGDWDSYDNSTDLGIENEAVQPSSSKSSQFNDSQWEDYAREPESNQNSFIPVQDEVYKSPIQESMPRKVSLGYKAVACIIIFMCIIVAVVLYRMQARGSDVAPVTMGSSTNINTVEPTSVPASKADSSVSKPKDGVVLIEIPEDVFLNYTGDVLEASGTVLSKKNYVSGHQVLYCITIRVAIGSSVEDISYYCNYASYTSVGVGDLVFIKYQQVADGFISVNSISK